MKITEIEVIPIAPKLATRYATRRVDLYGIDFRIVYKVHTDAGITGYGDVRMRPWATPSRDELAPLIGKSPLRSALLDKGHLALRSNLHQPDSRNDTYVFALPLICTQSSLLQRTDLGRILRAIHQTERTGTLWRQVCHP